MTPILVERWPRCGHPKSPSNSLRQSEGFVCKECKYTAQAQWRLRKARESSVVTVAPIDPATELYRLEKARRAATPRPAIVAAKAEYETHLATLKAARRTGRPRTRVLARTYTPDDLVTALAPFAGRREA